MQVVANAMREAVCGVKFQRISERERCTKAWRERNERERMPGRQVRAKRRRSARVVRVAAA